MVKIVDAWKEHSDISNRTRDWVDNWGKGTILEPSDLDGLSDAEAVERTLVACIQTYGASGVAFLIDLARDEVGPDDDAALDLVERQMAASNRTRKATVEQALSVLQEYLARDGREFREVKLAGWTDDRDESKYAPIYITIAGKPYRVEGHWSYEMCKLSDLDDLVTEEDRERERQLCLSLLTGLTTRLNHISREKDGRKKLEQAVAALDKIEGG